MEGRVLVIAGSDSGGGAGIQGDIKTITALGGYASSVLTALTAQNTRGVFGIHEVSANFIRQQIKLVLDDIGADVIKIGMLHSEEVVQTLVSALSKYTDIPIVLDPVVIAGTGARLLQRDGVHALKLHLLPLATMVTPNIPEAEILSSHTINTVEDMITAGRAILTFGPQAVLIKGGHGDGPKIFDILVTPQGEETFISDRVPNRNPHGTGCALASAIACKLAQKKDLNDAVGEAIDYVHGAIVNAIQIGKGNSPINHGWQIK